jgi:hypothetical protein
MSRPESRQAPPPLAQAFVVCREIFDDPRRREFILVGPFSGINAPKLPLNFTLSIYAHVTGGHGAYDMGLELRDGDESPLWKWNWPEPIRLDDPLMPHRLVLYDARVEFPALGRYDLVLLANGAEVARHALFVNRPPARKQGPP